MPDEGTVIDTRERIAFRRALKVFEDSLNGDATLEKLRLVEPRFATGVGEIGVLNPDDQVVMVEVDINDLGRTVRTGSLDNTRRTVTDAAAAARTLGLTLSDGEALLGRVENALRAGVAAHAASTAEYYREARRLTRNMDTLRSGLERIARTYGDHVTLLDEDPLTFGAGHFVFYPVANSQSRFAIEERYTGTDWSDPERLPTSWTWSAEQRTSLVDGSRWRVVAHGEIPSDDAVAVIRTVSAWAQRIRDIGPRSGWAASARRALDVPRL